MCPCVDPSLMLTLLVHSVPSLDSHFTSMCTSDFSGLMYSHVHSSSRISAALYTNMYTHSYNSDILLRSSTHSNSYRLFIESCQLVSILLDSSLSPGQHPHNSSLNSEHTINSLPPTRLYINSRYAATHH